MINSGPLQQRIRLEVQLNDASNNQPVLTGSGQVMQLKKGVTQVTASSVSSVLYNVVSSGYGVDANANGFLPIGVFNVCFRVVLIGSDYTETLAEECETIQ